MSFDFIFFDKNGQLMASKERLLREEDVREEGAGVQITREKAYAAYPRLYFECRRALPSSLHDLPTGAMRNLERFLDAAAELGVRLRQDFALECVPILDGRIVRPIADIFSPTRAV